MPVQWKTESDPTMRERMAMMRTPSSILVKPLAARSLQVRTFVKNEDQNFSLFNYVNEQQNEVEKLEEQLNQLEEEEKKFTQV